MQCLHCRVRTARTLVFLPSHPKLKTNSYKRNLHCQTALEWKASCGICGKCSVSSAQNKTASGRRWWHRHPKKKRQTLRRAAVSSSAESGQWFLHNNALRQFRTSISDWICKHWLILARGSRGWALHISVSQRVCSGRDRCAIGLDWLHQDCCWGWVQVLGLEEYTL